MDERDDENDQGVEVIATLTGICHPDHPGYVRVDDVLYPVSRFDTVVDKDALGKDRRTLEERLRAANRRAVDAELAAAQARTEKSLVEKRLENAEDEITRWMRSTIQARNGVRLAVDLLRGINNQATTLFNIPFGVPSTLVDLIGDDRMPGTPIDHGDFTGVLSDPCPALYEVDVPDCAEGCCDKLVEVSPCSKRNNHDGKHRTLSGVEFDTKIP